ncbi:MAG: hypothetical protein ACAH59_13485 [Pseudobdellovibrionaceae bacterium]
MRKGRYRKNLLLPEDCPSFAAAFFPSVQNLKQDLLQKQISPVEFVASYVLTGLQMLRPKDWKGARLQSGDPKCALSTLQTFSLRGIPLSVNRSLSGWAQGNYPLELCFHVPDTESILKWQSSGFRCVTCVTDLAELSSYILGERDPLSFTLHDLIHADHFFQNPEQRNVQIGFSRWMLELWRQPAVQNALSQNPHLASQFEYACADMNSHGAHLLKYLKAIFCQQGLQKVFLNEVDQSSFSADFKAAIHDLNSPQEKSEVLAALQKELFLKGSTSGQDQKDRSVSFRQISPEGISPR